MRPARTSDRRAGRGQKQTRRPKGPQRRRPRSHAMPEGWVRTILSGHGRQKSSNFSTLMSTRECRRRQIVLPGISVIALRCADALVAAERRIEARISGRLDDAMRRASRYTPGRRGRRKALPLRMASPVRGGPKLGRHQPVARPAGVPGRLRPFSRGSRRRSRASGRPAPSTGERVGGRGRPHGVSAEPRSARRGGARCSGRPSPGRAGD